MVELTNKVEGEKFQQLEKVVKALSQKVLSLESELKELKNKSEEEKGISFNINDVKYSSSTPKDVKQKAKKGNSKEKLLTCTECSYKCKKEISMKKHMLTNHEDHQCKECKDKLPTFMELLRHVAKHHCIDEGDNHKQAHDEDAFLKPEESKVNKQKYIVEGEKEKVAGFVFGESILNELL